VYVLPGNKELGDTIAAVFARGINTVLLENHGIVVGSQNLFRAFMAFETLDFSARLEIEAHRLGTPLPLTREQITLSGRKVQPTLGHFVPGPASSVECTARRDMGDLVHRACDQQPISSTQGTFSQRVDGNNFIITPYGADRKYLELGDRVRVEAGCAEAGKVRSRRRPWCSG
jgi:L-fuculose-phosphate aldolase